MSHTNDPAPIEAQPRKPIQVLAVSDQIDPRIHSSTLKERMPDVSLVFGCGDLPARYLEFLADALNKPVYFVLGNHLEELTRRGEHGKPYEPMGCVDIGGKVVRDPASGIILAGIPGSPRYRDGEEQQYTEGQVAWMLRKMSPRLLANRARHGRALDVLITHAPPRDVNDRQDIPHRGFVALRTFLERYRPAYHLHGHVHLYDRGEPSVTRFEQTEVINVYPYRVITFDVNGDGLVLRPPGGVTPP
jgi:Icc-related predicted phosphoesterase